MGESLYAGQVFALKFVFESEYPIEAPQVSSRTILSGFGWIAA
jgi:ubiquitin-protein ligase